MGIKSDASSMAMDFGGKLRDYGNQYSTFIHPLLNFLIYPRFRSDFSHSLDANWSTFWLPFQEILHKLIHKCSARSNDKTRPERFQEYSDRSARSRLLYPRTIHTIHALSLGTPSPSSHKPLRASPPPLYTIKAAIHRPPIDLLANSVPELVRTADERRWSADGQVDGRRRVRIESIDDGSKKE